MEPNWLTWGRKLQAIAQSGLAHTGNPFDAERYEAVRAVAADMLADRTGGGPEAILGLFAQDRGYATPKVDVRGAVFEGDRLLMVKEDLAGGWAVPGGWAEINEPPSQSVEREIFEESGYIAKARKLIAVYDRLLHPQTPHPWHSYKIFFLCDKTGGEATTSIETSEVAFFSKEEIAALPLAKVTPDQLAHVFEHHRHPERPADFD